MASVSTSIDIGTAPDRVWDLVIDLDRLGEWVTIHRELRGPAPASVEEGATFSQRLEVAGTPFDVDWTATAVDAPQRLVWAPDRPVAAPARSTRSTPTTAARASPTRTSSRCRAARSATRRAAWWPRAPARRPRRRCGASSSSRKPEPVARHKLGVALFLAAALASFLLSVGLWFAGERQEGLFVGLWVPSILAAGAFWLAAVRG